MGPLLGRNVDVEKLEDFFPIYHWIKPLVCRTRNAIKGSVIVDSHVQTVDDQEKSLTDSLNQEKHFNLDYMSNTLKVFFSCPLAKYPDPYLSCLTKLEKKKALFWREMGFYDTTQQSKVEPAYC